MALAADLARAATQLRRDIAPKRTDVIVEIGEVWRKPRSVPGAPVAGGIGVDKRGFRISEGTVPSESGSRFAQVAALPCRISKTQQGKETDFGGQQVTVLPWTLRFNWDDNPDIRGDDKIIIAITERVRGITQRKVWKASTRVVVGELVQPVASNGRYYRCTVAGITGASEPAFPAGDTPKGATFSDGAATWEYVDKLRTFEVKDPGGETTFKVSRVVGAEEIKA